MSKTLNLNEMVKEIQNQINSGDAGNSIRISGNTTKKALTRSLIAAGVNVNSVQALGNKFTIHLCGAPAIA